MGIKEHLREQNRRLYPTSVQSYFLLQEMKHCKHLINVQRIVLKFSLYVLFYLLIYTQERKRFTGQSG